MMKIKVTVERTHRWSDEYVVDAKSKKEAIMKVEDIMKELENAKEGQSINGIEVISHDEGGEDGSITAQKVM